MAAGKITVLDIALEKIIKADFDFNTDGFSLVLTTKDQPLTSAFLGASGQAVYADLTDEVTGKRIYGRGAPNAWRDGNSLGRHRNCFCRPGDLGGGNINR